MEQVIRTAPYVPEYGYSPTIEHVGLASFVNGPLNECVKTAWHGVERLRYVEGAIWKAPDGMARRYEQAVIIEFDNGYRKIANVTGDSNIGALEDVMRQL